MNQPKVYDVLPSKGPKEQKIIDAFLRQQTIQNSQTAFQNRILPRDWQVCAASEILDRRDTIVITATGSGKSLTYLLALIANPEKILLGIFPLLSLMTDQVQAARKLGIRACRITYSTLRDDPNLLRDISMGQYELVCASPEFVTPENQQFASLFRNEQFRRNLFAIVIDEAHLCYIWHVFRPQYARLGVLRILFPNTPIMALSATLSPHVMLYAQKVLKLNTPTGLIKRSIDRPNIYLHCNPIEHGIASRKDLLFLVPPAPSLNDIFQIPKTIIFMDSRVAVCETATMLIHQLPPQFRSADVVCDYSTALSEQRREEIMEKFTCGLCRILVCTEAAGMGVDVSDVVRVVQWTIPRHVNLASFWQRAGRCGRDRAIAGVAILFYNKAQCVPVGIGHPLEIFCETGSSTNLDQILDAIKAYDTGEFGNRQRGQGEVQGEGPPPTAQLAVSLTEDNIPIELEPNTSRSGREAISAQIDQSSPGQSTNTTEEAIIEGNQPAPANSLKSNPRGMKQFATVDRGILWFVSTTGCRRLTVLSYFNDTKNSPFQALSTAHNPSSVTDQNHNQVQEHAPISEAFCDNCALANEQLLPEAITSLLPLCQPAGACHADTTAEVNGMGQMEEDVLENSAQQPSRRDRVSPAVKARLYSELKRFREEIWIREGLNQRMSMFGSSFFLPEKHLQTLVQRCASIEDIQTLEQVLARHKIDLQFSAIGPYAHELLGVIVSTIRTSGSPTLLAVEGISEVPDSQIPGPPSYAESTNLPVGPTASGVPSPSTTAMAMTENSATNTTTGMRSRNSGRPTAALRAEQNRLKLLVEAEAEVRFLASQADGTDRRRWDLSLLGKRARGRPKAGERHDRQLAEAGVQELQDQFLNQNEFPLLRQRKMNEAGGDSNRLSPAHQL